MLLTFGRANIFHGYLKGSPAQIAMSAPFLFRISRNCLDGGSVLLRFSFFFFFVSGIAGQFEFVDVTFLAIHFPLK